VTGSLGEVRRELAGVAACLNEAYGHARVARARLGDALAALTELGHQHSAQLPPPQLGKAADELDRSLGIIAAGATALADLDARL